MVVQYQVTGKAIGGYGQPENFSGTFNTLTEAQQFQSMRERTYFGWNVTSNVQRIGEGEAEPEPQQRDYSIPVNPESPEYKKYYGISQNQFIGAGTYATSNVVLDVKTGKNVLYKESSQYKFEQNLALARQQNQISPSSAEELRYNFYVQQQKPINVEITSSSTAGQLLSQLPPEYRTPENLRNIAQQSIDLRQQNISQYQDMIARQYASLPVETQQKLQRKAGAYVPLTTLEQQYTPDGRIDIYNPQKFNPSRIERLTFESTFGTPFQQTKAEFGLGIEKAKQIPTLLMAGGFAGLRAFAPRLASTAAIGTTLFSVKPLQEEIARKGLTKTIAYELPTLGLFIGAERIGATARVLTLPKSEIPVNLRFAQIAELKSVQTEQGKIIRINPIDFVAQADKTEIAGRGVGKAIITEKGKLGATFQYQLETPKLKESFIGLKGLIKETPEGFKSLSIFKEFTSEGKEINKGITYSRTKEIIAGEFPRYISKTIEYAPKLERGKLVPLTGASSVLKKEFEIITSNFVGKPITIETYSFFEKGTSAKNIIKAFPKQKIDIIKPPKANFPIEYSSMETKPKTILKTTGKESIVSGEFISGLKQVIRQQIKPSSFGEFVRVKPRIILTRVKPTRAKQIQQQSKQQSEQFFSQIKSKTLPIIQTMQLQQPILIQQPFQQPIAFQQPATYQQSIFQQPIQHQIVQQKTGLLQKTKIEKPPIFEKPPNFKTFFSNQPKLPLYIPIFRKKAFEDSNFGFLRKSRQKKGYTSSLIAEEFGIRTKTSLSKLSKQTFTGQEIRGLPREVFENGNRIGRRDKIRKGKRR